MGVKIAGVLDRPFEGAPMADQPEFNARTVIMLPEEGRAALRSLASDLGADMGEIAFELFQLDPRYREALDRIRRLAKGRKKNASEGN